MKEVGWVGGEGRCVCGGVCACVWRCGGGGFEGFVELCGCFGSVSGVRGVQGVWCEGSVGSARCAGFVVCRVFLWERRKCWGRVGQFWVCSVSMCGEEGERRGGGGWEEEGIVFVGWREGCSGCVEPFLQSPI